jgi:hypothetical protein
MAVPFSLPDDMVRQLLLPDFQAQVSAWLQQVPQPDPQYTLAQVADLLNVDAKTVARYLGLPADHPKALPWVPCTDSPKGRRVLLSDVRAWQQRNRRTSAPAPAPAPKQPACRNPRPERRRANP